MKKVLLTATVQSHIAQFHKPLINMLKENGYEVHVAARNNLAEKNGLRLSEPDKIYDVPFDRSPLSKNNILAYRDLNKLLSENNYDIVHCNTPMGGVLTRLAGSKYRKRGMKIFYTAHGFHFYKGAPKKNWMVYYPIEKFLARYTDKLITITKEDFLLANSKFDTEVIHIHGVGVNTEKFYQYTEKEISKLRKKLGYAHDNKLLICIGELNDNKNQSVIIKAVAELVNNIPGIRLMLAGNGPMEEDLKTLVTELKMQEYVKFLGYRTDLEKYINIADVLVTASYREGLPLNVMEGMLCGKAVIASRNRGNKELVYHGKSGYLFESNDPKELAKYLIDLLIDKEKRLSFGEQGKLIVDRYSKEVVVTELFNIYMNSDINNKEIENNE